MHKEIYHGWHIELVSEATGYSFQCWLPSDRLAVSDRKTYPTLESARNAAQKRADLEAVKWALKHCYSNYVQGSLNSDEYSTLEDLIMGVLTPSKESQMLA
jgi:hypothetical protein